MADPVGRQGTMPRVTYGPILKRLKPLGVLGSHGGGDQHSWVPLSLYADRHSIFHTTREPTIIEQLKDVVPLTQFGRAMEELGISVMKAWTPQAKGRIGETMGGSSKTVLWWNFVWPEPIPWSKPGRFLSAFSGLQQALLPPSEAAAAVLERHPPRRYCITFYASRRPGWSKGSYGLL